MNKRPTDWTEEMDAQLRDMWFRRSICRCADALGMSGDRVRTRAVKLGLPGRKTKAFKDHLAQVWMDAARKEAIAAQVSLREILSGVKRPEIVIARWRAWRAVMASGNCPSVTLLAEVAGFDHSAISYGLARNAGLPGKYMPSGDWSYARKAMPANDCEEVPLARSIGEIIEQHFDEIVGGVRERA